MTDSQVVVTGTPHGNGEGAGEGAEESAHAPLRSPASVAELEACLLMRVTLPPLYPLGSGSWGGAAVGGGAFGAGGVEAAPRVEVADAMVTDPRATALDDKPLASLAYLGAPRGGGGGGEAEREEEAAAAAATLPGRLAALAAAALPEPCLHELLAVHLPEVAFDFVHVHAYAAQPPPLLAAAAP